MRQKTIREKLTVYGIEKVLDLVRSDPDKNIPKLVEWFDKLARVASLNNTRRVVHSVTDDPDNIWYAFIKSLWTDIDDDVRATILKNFVAHIGVISHMRQEKNKALYNCNIPWAILMDPTSACNLNCTGCWAAEYGSKLSMDYDTLQSIIRQGKELGTYLYIYSGGEPLIRKKDIIRLCEEHDDCMFLSFTNGTLIDEEFTDEMLRVKNFVPAISIEGFEAQTDARRGRGTYAKVMRAMELLKEKKLLFGSSCCYTSKNTEVLGSEAFYDHLIDKGNKFIWFFTYMPVGVHAPTSLIATADQRAFMYRQVRKFREAKPIFALDFWNDGEYVHGCIAGGKSYLHINANGDIEPCAFIHYSDTNIHESTLLDALKGPLFTQYRKNQPFNENHLRPCPLLDNNGMLARMVHASGAHSTDMSAPEDVDALCAKCKCAADDWAVLSEKLWAKKQAEEEGKEDQMVQVG